MPDHKNSIGAEIRQLRKARQLTIPDMAELTGLSTGFLSQVERGKSTLSVQALKRISAAFGIPASFFFNDERAEDPVEREHVVRAGRRRSIGLKDGIVDEVLSPTLRGNIEFVLSTFPAGATCPKPFVHDGDESGFIVEGALELNIEDQNFTLGPGDSFCFKGDRAHSYRNASAGNTVVVWVISPPRWQAKNEN